MLVGGIRTIAEAERVVAEGVAEFVSLSRPLICEPGLVARWQSGDRAPRAAGRATSASTAASGARE